MNGQATHGLNGTVTSNTVASGGIGKGKGRAKDAVQEVAPEPVLDGFVDDAEGDDEGLYD